jgi:DNA-directed RNA polymerase
LPNNVDEMNEILREKFVELYKIPILNQLRDFWLTRDPYLDLPPLPDTGKGFDIEMVKLSKYFFH